MKTVKDIIYEYISDKLVLNKQVIINTVTLCNDVVEYGKAKGIFHTPETYLRAFREIRSKNLFNDFIIEEQKIPNRIINFYKITKK